MRYTFAILILCSLHLYSAEYKIYLDADQTEGRGLRSSKSIAIGIQTALAEQNHKIGSHKVQLVIKDHRESSPRSKKNLKDFLNDPEGLAVFGGMHSPPILSNKDYINENNFLFFDPWAAAGPITRSSGKVNNIFRLSIDDSKAGTYITEYAIKEGFKKPYLILEDTDWGKSNQRTMTSALDKGEIQLEGISWFNWGIGEEHAKILMRDVLKTKADVLFLVCNSPEGVTLLKALHELKPSNRPAIRSHWGITGGKFYSMLGKEVIQNLNLKFIQTKFSFNSSSLNSFHMKTFTTLKAQDKSISKYSNPTR